jgi:hypothetical protein
MALLTYTWTRVDKLSRVAHLAHIRWKVSLDRMRTKPARYYHRPRLAITPTQYPSSLSPSIHLYVLIANLQIFAQPDSVHTVKDALAHISQPQPVQVGQLSPRVVSQQVQIEALPSVLVLHLNRFVYDAAADGVVKISKPVLFAPELEIPLGTMLSFISPVSRLRIPRFQKLWHLLPRNLGSQRTTSYMGCSIIMATWRAAGTIRSTCSTGAETAVVRKVGCTSMMELFARWGTRACLEAMVTTGVLTCYSIVALPPRGHDGPFTLDFTLGDFVSNAFSRVLLQFSSRGLIPRLDYYMRAIGHMRPLVQTLERWTASATQVAT